MLRLYRGVASLTPNDMSEELKSKMVKPLRNFIMGLTSDKRVDANMWLSVYDSAQKVEDEEVQTLALSKFNNLFDWDSLNTASTPSNSTDKPTTGRRVKR